MFKNYMKTALRNIKRRFGYSFINIMGLAIGIACCILILLYVFDELSYDRFHENSDRIYRVTRQWFNDDGVVNLHLGHVAPPVGPLLKNDFPDIQYAVRLTKVDGLLVGNGSVFFEEPRFFFAEDDIFEVFTFEMTAGDPEKALRDPFTMVITEEMAERYFGSENPLGQVLTLEAAPHRADMTVTGVIKSLPHNSHFHADFVGSFKTYEAVVGDSELQRWESNNYATYLLMPENYDIDLLADQLDPFIERHLSQGMSERTKLKLQKLTDIHLFSHLDSEIESNGDITYVYIFSVIAFFVLLIACINFMNLATARSATRAKETGLRKVVGAQRSQLIRQFLSESVITALFSMLIALVIILLVLPAFNRFVGRSLSLGLDQNLPFLCVIVIITIVVGIASGLYPAFIISSYSPVQALKGNLDRRTKSFSFRSALVVFQFAVSIVLIICVAIVSGQLNYMRNRDLGFDKEHIVVLPSSPAMLDRLEAFKSRLLSNPNILGVSAAGRVPSGRLLDSSGASLLSGETRQPVSFRIAQLGVDFDYIPTYRMEMAAGRNFSREISTDGSQAFILNETAVRRIGWKNPQEAIGQSFGYGRRDGLIIGVVKDFHFESLHHEISPLVFFLSSSDLNRISIRISSRNIPETLSYLEKIWNEARSEYPFTYSFIDESFDRLYRSEENLQRIFEMFAFLAVFIGCLGLFGLASYSSERRSKEIAVRKVLGSSALGIVILLSKELTRWALFANFIAWPVGYYFMSRWMHNFAYRSTISFSVFIFAGFLTWVIASLTVCYQTIKASLADPVAALKYE